MNTEIICALIAGGASVLAALAERRSRQSAKRTEARAQRREKESRLAMELMYANCALSLTTAKKLAGMITNSDVEEAMEAARSAQEAYVDLRWGGTATQQGLTPGAAKKNGALSSKRTPPCPQSPHMKHPLG